MRGLLTVLVVVHGILGDTSGVQFPPVTTSGNVLFGGINVTNPEAFPHHENPRKSVPLPCNTSENISVLLVPSEISDNLTGFP